MALEIANQTKYRISRPLLERAVQVVLRLAQQRGDISIVIVGDAAMKKLNYKFRKKNTPTDILSFAEIDSEEPQAGFIGELIINIDQIKRQAKKFDHSIKWELVFIVIHGTLHLVGYKDKTKAGYQEMEKIGDRLITKINI